MEFSFLTFSWFLTIFKPKKGFFSEFNLFLIHKLCITSFYSVRNENDSWLGYKGSKNGWDTIKRFLLYWKIIRVDFPDACFCIISINCDSFVKTSNFINLRCTGNNHVAILYKNFLTTKIMPKILNDSFNYFLSKVRDFKKLSRSWLVHWTNIDSSVRSRYHYHVTRVKYDHVSVNTWQTNSTIFVPIFSTHIDELAHSNGILKHVIIFHPGHMIMISWSKTWGKYCIRA